MKTQALFITLTLIVFPSANALLYLPGLPQIANDFAMPVTLVQCTVSVYLLGLPLGSLLSAPLQNRLSPKTVLYVAIGIAFLGTSAAALSHRLTSFTLLMVGRFISAIGAVIIGNTGYTMIGQYTSSKTTRRITGYAVGAESIMYGIAIFVGGFLVQYFGWVSCFYTLSVSWIIIALLSTKLPNFAYHLQPDTLNLRNIYRRFKETLSNRLLLLYGVISGLSSGLYAAYVTSVPFTAIDTLGLTPDQFGLFNLLPEISGLIANLLVATVAVRWASKQTIKWGLGIALIANLIFLILFLLGVVSLWSLFLPVAGVMFGEGTIFPEAYALSIRQGNNRPRAVAITEFLGAVLRFLASFLIGLFGVIYVGILPLFLFIMLIFMYVLYRCTYRYEKRLSA